MTIHPGSAPQPRTIGDVVVAKDVSHHGRQRRHALEVRDHAVAANGSRVDGFQRGPLDAVLSTMFRP